MFDNDHTLEKSCLLQIMESLQLQTNVHDICNLLDTSMVWKFVGKSTSNLLDTSMDRNFLEICWKYHGNLLEVEISMIWRRHDFPSDTGIEI